MHTLLLSSFLKACRCRTKSWQRTSKSSWGELDMATVQLYARLWYFSLFFPRWCWKLDHGASIFGLGKHVPSLSFFSFSILLISSSLTNLLVHCPSQRERCLSFVFHVKSDKSPEAVLPSRRFLCHVVMQSVLADRGITRCIRLHSIGAQAVCQLYWQTK